MAIYSLVSDNELLEMIKSRGVCYASITLDVLANFSVFLTSMKRADQYHWTNVQVIFGICVYVLSSLAGVVYIRHSIYSMPSSTLMQRYLFFNGCGYLILSLTKDYAGWVVSSVLTGFFGIGAVASIFLLKSEVGSKEEEQLIMLERKMTRMGACFSFAAMASGLLLFEIYESGEKVDRLYLFFSLQFFALFFLVVSTWRGPAFLEANRAFEHKNLPLQEESVIYTIGSASSSSSGSSSDDDDGSAPDTPPRSDTLTPTEFRQKCIDYQPDPHQFQSVPLVVDFERTDTQMTIWRTQLIYALVEVEMDVERTISPESRQALEWHYRGSLFLALVQAFLNYSMLTFSIYGTSLFTMFPIQVILGTHCSVYFVDLMCQTCCSNHNIQLGLGTVGKRYQRLGLAYLVIALISLWLVIYPTQVNAVLLLCLTAICILASDYRPYDSLFALYIPLKTAGAKPSGYIYTYAMAEHVGRILAIVTTVIFLRGYRHSPFLFLALLSIAASLVFNRYSIYSLHSPGATVRRR